MVNIPGREYIINKDNSRQLDNRQHGLLFGVQHEDTNFMVSMSHHIPAGDQKNRQLSLRCTVLLLSKMQRILYQSITLANKQAAAVPGPYSATYLKSLKASKITYTAVFSPL